MGQRAYFRMRREGLMKKDPHCHWCGKELHLYGNWANVQRQLRKGDPRRRLPDDFPTIDHLYDRVNGRRRPSGLYGYEQTLVLACPACNEGRASAKELSEIWKKRWVSNSWPRWCRWFMRWYKKRKTRNKNGRMDPLSKAS